MGGGRARQRDFFRCFTELGKKRAECKYCGVTMCDDIGRMLGHLAKEYPTDILGPRGSQKCEKAPPDVAACIQKIVNHKVCEKNKKRKRKNEDSCDEQDSKRLKAMEEEL